MEGHLTLINIKIPNDGLLQSIDDETGTTQLYSGVTATFCHISWDLQDDNPSTVPMFQDLQRASFLCPGTMFTADLWDIARQAERYDARNHTFAATTPGAAQTAVPPTAVIFHESRCGSTLIANALAAFAPHHTRVYSEAAPPVAAIQACESHAASPRFCDQESHVKLIQDVFYIMGRVTRPLLPQYVFYKIQSVGVQSIDAFALAMPSTPWIFAYRDSIEVMMSHFHHYQTTGQQQQQQQQVMPRSSVSPDCLRNYGKPDQLQPTLVTELVDQAGRQVAQLTREEYCAVHIAALAEAAVREHERTKHLVGTHAVTAMAGRDAPTSSSTTTTAHDGAAGSNHVMGKTVAPPHWFVNYNELPYKIWETILPSLVVGALRPDEIERMHAAAKVYSKARGDGTKQHWKEDSTLKQGKAPSAVKDAVTLFLDPVYAQMEAIRQSMDPSK